jgi:hypothetical protein
MGKLWRKVIIVAAQFPGEGPAEKMPLSRLEFWYAAHEAMTGKR